MAKKAIALVGCGHWGQFILRDLVSLGCEVHVVARSDASRARAKEHCATSIVSTLGALPRVDGGVVATSSSAHAEVSEALLDRGVPVYVEKPLTIDVANARRLAARGEGRLFVMEKWRYHPGVEELARIAKSGELGPVHGIVSTRVQWGHRRREDDAVWILAPHDLSIANEVLGHIPEPRFAVGEQIEGQPASLFAVLGGAPFLSLEVSLRSPERRRVVRLHCRDGVAVLGDAYADHVALFRGKSSSEVTVASERRPVSTELPLLRQLRAFLEFLSGGPPPKGSAADGLRGVEVLQALRTMAGFAR